MGMTAEGRPSSGPDRCLIMTSRIRERRHALGLTQKQVVTRLALLGVPSTNKALSSLEHGAGIDVGKLPELAAALDCTVTYLLALTDDPTSWLPDASAPVGARFSHPPAPEHRARAVSSTPLATSAPASDASPTQHQSGWILAPLAPAD